MLNSKYAPIVALTALGIIVVAVLGWFLAIKPQIDQASAFSADEDLVRSNIGTVQADAAAIAQAGSSLETYPDLQPSIDLNAPQRLDLASFRTRMSQTIEASGVEIASSGQSYGSLVEGWAVPSALLPSTDVAKRFQSGPAPTTTVVAPAFTPVVTVQAGENVLAEGLAMVPFDFVVVGTPDETYNFLKGVQDPAQPFLQIYEMQMDGLTEGSSVSEGVSDPSDGDVQTTFKAALYLSDVDVSSLDEGPVVEATVPNDSPFIAPEEDAPEQPGAN